MRVTRTWRRRPETIAVAGGALAGLIVVALAVPALVDAGPREGGGDSGLVAVGESPAAGPRSDPGAASGDGEVTGAGGTDSGALADTAGTGSAAAAGGAGRGAPTARVGGLSDSSPAAPGTPGQAAGGPSGLSATDRGVTADRVKVGFLLLDIGSVGRLGVDVAIDPEQQQAALQAFVDEINEAGGILGRAIEPVYRTYDVTSASSQRTACLSLTQDAKVFAVVGAFNFVAPTLCLVEENETPNFSNISNNPDSVFARSKGRLVGIFPRGGRMVAQWAAELDALGALKGKKIGIATDENNDPNAETARTLAAILARRGHEVVHETRFSADLSTASSQVPVEVNQMRSKGVEVVMFLVSTTVHGASFVQQAEAQRWQPQYTTTDWSSNFTESGTQAMTEAYEGAINVTSTRNSEFRVNRPEPPEAVRCKEIYERRTGRTLATRGSNEYSLTINFCDSLRIFTAAARGAGPELTRPRISAAVQQLGRIELGIWGGGAYAPGKFDLNDVVRIQRWRYSCRCWMPEDDFHPARG